MVFLFYFILNLKSNKEEESVGWAGIILEGNTRWIWMGIWKREGGGGGLDEGIMVILMECVLLCRTSGRLINVSMFIRWI